MDFTAIDVVNLFSSNFNQQLKHLLNINMPQTKKETKEDKIMEQVHNSWWRRILNVSIYDVIPDHTFINEYVRRETRLLQLSSYLELRTIGT